MPTKLAWRSEVRRGACAGAARLTAKLTANGSQSCRCGSTAMDRYKPSTCTDGRRWTGLDGRERVMSPPVRDARPTAAATATRSDRGGLPRSSRPAASPSNQGVASPPWTCRRSRPEASGSG